MTPPSNKQRKDMYTKLKKTVSFVNNDNTSSPSYSERYDGGMDYDNSTASLSSSTNSSQLSTDGSLYMGECFAPPGKLGIALDTINGQPVVHRVREESPLAGVLRRLDVIIGIDDEDTSTMSAADVTMLMAKKMDQRRKITYMRGKRAKDHLRKDKSTDVENIVNHD